MLLALHLDDAHPARSKARQLGLVAESGDLDAVGAADLQNRLALEALDDSAVDLETEGGRRKRALRILRRDQAFGGRVVELDDGVERSLRIRPAVGPAGPAVPDLLLVRRRS